MKRRTLFQFAGAGLASAGLPAWLHASASKRQYQQPSEHSAIVLPKDHGPHPDFRTEWWYFTGWFSSPARSEPIGIQITFFRSAPEVDPQNPSRFNPTQLLFAHAALALPSKGQLKHAEIIRRSGSGQVQWQSEKPSGPALNLRMPGWSLSSMDGQTWTCSIQTPELRMRLQMMQTQPPWLQGNQGFSRKGPKEEHSSHYITLPHLKSAGEIQLNGEQLPVQGEFWMDHEWSSTVLADNAQGWDWVGLHGKQGESLMAFQIRNKDAAQNPVWKHAALRDQLGQVREFKSVSFKPLRQWKSTRTGIQYPVSQTLMLDDLNLTLEPLMNDQELDARSSTGTLYWEGAVRVKTASGEPWGQGYLEMTGYDRPMKL